ncbi:MAG TPA: HEAT repeat domain-containing protein [Pyrinomonadaceae bacterium]|jgi:hypothetical protein|nr:HEAT repeat domain-containing protein [Pyrinomonadaceae bacterium]
MARDYLQEASSVIFKDSVSLGSLLDSDPDGVVGNLLRTVATAQGVMGPTLRKAAAYALGQIGEPRSVKQLREFYDQEPADGVRDAMRASLTAIKLAPTPTHSQLERCRIIDDVYHDRRLADWN